MITSKKLRLVMLSMKLWRVINQQLRRLRLMKIQKIGNQVFLGLALSKWEINKLLKINQISQKNLLLVKVQVDHLEHLKWEIPLRIKINQKIKSHPLGIFQ
jgi:hypothetical protein